ncbi:hypothetical protein ACS0TY_019335 [Phlomoides rotata]
MKGSQHHHLHTNSLVSTTLVRPPSSNNVLDNLTGQEHSLQIIPIVGMGGIYKTTLAINIYTKPLIDQHFDIRAWVIISQEYSRRNILQILCQEITGNSKDLTSRMSEDELGVKLYHLCGRRTSHLKTSCMSDYLAELSACVSKLKSTEGANEQVY